jgi:hypothetical protein
MHLALWTRLDIFTTCVVLAQYQNHPSHIHFAAVKHMVGYLCLHPDIPLMFDRNRFADTVGCFDIDIDPIDPLNIQFLGPESYHVASAQLLLADHAAYDLSVAAMEILTPHDRIRFVAPNQSARMRSSETTSLHRTRQLLMWHLHLRTAIRMLLFPVHLRILLLVLNRKRRTPKASSMLTFQAVSLRRLLILVLPSPCRALVFFPFCQKCDTATENTTEAEMTAANHLGRALHWLHLLMDDLGIAFDGPVPVAEDNAATRIIAHTLENLLAMFTILRSKRFHCKCWFKTGSLSFVLLVLLIIALTILPRP